MLEGGSWCWDYRCKAHAYAKGQSVWETVLAGYTLIVNAAVYAPIKVVIRTGRIPLLISWALSLRFITLGMTVFLAGWQFMWHDFNTRATITFLGCSFLACMGFVFSLIIAFVGGRTALLPPFDNSLDLCPDVRRAVPLRFSLGQLRILFLVSSLGLDWARLLEITRIRP